MKKKELMIRLLDVLCSQTDEQHPLTAVALSKILKQEYGLSSTRQTIYTTISLLNELGIEIFKTNGGFYYGNRMFEVSDLSILVHAIYSNNTIPMALTNELVSKLLSTQSDYVQEHFRNMIPIVNIDKKQNRQMSYTIDCIQEAIQKSQCIEFQYTKYDMDLNIVLKREKPYLVIPQFIVSKHNKLFLVTKRQNNSEIVHYRIDRIQNIKLIDKAFVQSVSDPYQYVKNRIYMYSGELVNIKLLVDEYMLDEIADLFGKNIKVVKSDHQYIITVKTTLQEAKFFAFQYIQGVKILKPEELVIQIKEELITASKVYEI